MNAVDGGPVHAGFSFCNRAKDPPRQVFLARSDARGPVDDRMDIGQMAVGVLFRVLDPHGRRAKTLLHDRARGELHSR